MSDDDILAQAGQTGWRGLFHNKKTLFIALFASLGGVLYGYSEYTTASL